MTPDAIDLTRLQFALLAILSLLVLCPASSHAGPPFAEFIDPNPNAGNQFGAAVVALSTGNVVITSPNDDAGGTNAGAVYLFNGATGALISTLKGSQANDTVGSSGVTALSNGNYVVRSAAWDNAGVVNAGAVTWGNGTSGTSGAVTSSNSLVGTKASDQVGTSGVTALSNGSYVVSSPMWDNAGVTDAGAVTWGNGTSGTSGAVTSSNSLVGTTASDQVGSSGSLFMSYSSVTALSNGNYVVGSASWDNAGVVDAGAVTWGSGTSGVSGAVTSSNSLVSLANNTNLQPVVTDAVNSTYFANFVNEGAGRVRLGSQIDGLAISVPYIFVAQASPLIDGSGSVPFVGVILGSINAPPLTFTITNPGTGDLTSLVVTLDGPDAADFTVSALSATSIPVGAGTATFTVTFSPSSGGAKTAALHIASNVTGAKNPFDISLTGTALAFTNDSDSDGLNDASEFQMAALGFDWQVSQPALVSTLMSSATGAGLYNQTLYNANRTAGQSDVLSSPNTYSLYTLSQVQAVNVGAPLLQKNPTTGAFTLTIGVTKSTDLSLFNPFSMTGPGTSTVINGAGKLEFQFTAPDNAAFFKVQAQ